MKEYILLKAQHCETDNLEPIFEADIDPMDFAAMESIAEKTLRELIGKAVTVYVNGSTAATVAVIKVCVRYNIDLILMHYNREENSYKPQIAYLKQQLLPIAGLEQWYPRNPFN